jgi:hypothetical protein
MRFSDVIAGTEHQAKPRQESTDQRDRRNVKQLSPIRPARIASDPAKWSLAHNQGPHHHIPPCDGSFLAEWLAAPTIILGLPQ